MKDTGKNPARPKEIFYAALELDGSAARSAFLARECGTDHDLRRRVELLIAAHEEAGPFMVNEARSVLRNDVSPIEGPGVIIGRYKLLEPIGEGGFGVVFMAEQLEPVQRRVAVKIIKPGMDSKQVIGRFEAERQALALMDHPSIAKVLDAGTTSSGRPFVVMELVRGLPITQYCDEHRLSTQERLRLFNDVCAAIHHAHQKGVIHRDIKPTNVLVTTDADRPLPKVIDFGIAKATRGRLTEKTVFTQFQHLIGTPAYMSPEQAELSASDVDTRSDIYSLGVLLYELLTGEVPFNSKELLDAGFDEIRRRIREDEPPKPSTRISRMTDAERTSVARHRGIPADRLGRLMRGDLDWIVMKAMEKDRSRRYETANSLMLDVHRALIGQPVTAAAPSRLYRIRKFTQRNKVGIGLVSAILASLLLGLCVALVFFFGERQARRLAQDRQYASDMQLAYATLDRNDVAHALHLLERHIPGRGEVDRRGWAWRYLWQQTHRELGTKRPFGDHPAAIHALSLSKNGRTLFVGGDSGPDRVTSIALIDTDSRHVREKFPFLELKSAWISQLKPLSDGGSLAVENAKTGLTLINLDDGTARQPLTKLDSPLFRISPNGQWLVGQFTGFDVEVRSSQSRDDLPVNSRATIFVAKFDDVYHFRIFDHDGQCVVDCSEDQCAGDRESLIRLKQLLAEFPDSTQLTREQQMDIVKHVCDSVSYSPYTTRRFRRFDLGTGQETAVSDAFHMDWRFFERKIYLSPDGKLLAAGCEPTKVLLFETDTLRQLDEFRVGGDVRCLAWSPGSSSLAVGTTSHTTPVELWDVEAGRQQSAFATSERVRPPIDCLRFSRDGSLLAVSALDQSITVWNLQSPADPLRIGTFHHTRVAKTLEFLPDSEILVSGGSSGNIKFWDLSGSQSTDLRRLKTDDLAYSAAGGFLAGVDDKGEVVLFDARTEARVDTLPHHPHQRVERLKSTGTDERVCFTPDGYLLVVGNGDHTATVYDIKSRTPRWLLKHDIAGQVSDITVAPDSQTIVIASGWSVHFWNSVDGIAQRAELPLHHKILAAEFSPDGSLLAFGGLDQSVTLWDVAHQQIVASIPTGSNVCSLRFSPDGKLLACGLTHEVQLIAVPSRKLMPKFGGLVGQVEGMCFSPDGTNLVVSCLGGIVRAFNLKVMNAVGDVLVTPSGYLGSVEFSEGGSQVLIADPVTGVRVLQAAATVP